MRRQRVSQGRTIQVAGKKAVVKSVAAIAEAAALAFSLAACSTSKNQSTASSQTSSSVSEKIDNTKNEKPQYGGTITLAYTSEQSGYDSALYNFGLMNNEHQTGNTLIEADWAKGPAGDDQAEFEASTPMLSVSKGALIQSWQFSGKDSIILHLRHGVHFGLNPNNAASKLVNGRELVAADVVYSIKRSFNMQPGVSLPNAYSLSRMTPDERPTSVVATDKYTVVVKGKPGYIGSLFYWITEMIEIYPPELIQKYGNLQDVHNDVGTGPFVFSEYQQNSSITFTKNSNYWDTNPVGPGKGDKLPYVSSVQYLTLPDLSTELSAFRTGKIDQIMNVSNDDFKQLIKENPKLQYKKIPTNPSGLALRSDKPNQPWYKESVRQALFMAIDRQSIIKEYFGGAADNLAFPIAPMQIYKSLGVYKDLSSLPADVQKLFTYNPTEAKKMLADAGYPNGFSIDVIVNASSQQDVDEASILKEEFAKIGVTLNLQQKDNSVYTSISSARSYDQAIFVDSLGNTVQAFHNFRPTDASNTAMIDDPTINKMISNFADDFMVNDAAAWPQLAKYTSYILQHSWYLFLPAADTYTVWQPWLKNYNGEYGLGGGHFNAWTRYAWVDQNLKKQLGH